MPEWLKCFTSISLPAKMGCYFNWSRPVFCIDSVAIVRVQCFWVGLWYLFCWIQCLLYGVKRQHFLLLLTNMTLLLTSTLTLYIGSCSGSWESGVSSLGKLLRNCQLFASYSVGQTCVINITDQEKTCIDCLQERLGWKTVC